jgi:hypothetical protein
MTPPQSNPPHPLQIRTPCPRRWEELVGGDAKRYCSQCELHVHNAAELTRREAAELVANATDRLCMRLELDPQGEPEYRDTRAPEFPAVPPRRSIAARVAGWAVSAAAGVLAACARTESPPPAVHPELTPCTTNSNAILGKVAATERLGDVAAPTRPSNDALLGEVSIAMPKAVETPGERNGTASVELPMPTDVDAPRPAGPR